MVFWLVAAAAAAYLVIAFFASAMTVRLAPHHPVAQQLRRRLAIFPFVPLVLLVTALTGAVGRTMRILRLLARAFEMLSGRRQIVRIRFSPYGYAYGQSQRKRRPSPPLRASDATTSHPIVPARTQRVEACVLRGTGISPRDMLSAGFEEGLRTGVDPQSEGIPLEDASNRFAQGRRVSRRSAPAAGCLRGS